MNSKTNVDEVSLASDGSPVEALEVAAVQVDGANTILPKPMILEWQQMPTRTGLYLEYPRNGKKALHYLVVGEGTGPPDGIKVPTIDAKESWWLGPIVVP